MDITKELCNIFERLTGKDDFVKAVSKERHTLENILSQIKAIPRTNDADVQALLRLTEKKITENLCEYKDQDNPEKLLTAFLKFAKHLDFGCSLKSIYYFYVVSLVYIPVIIEIHDKCLVECEPG